MRREAFKPDRMSIVGRVVLEGKTIHLADAQADSDPVLAQRSHLGGVRSTLGVPLLREGTPIGVLLLQRGDVQPFTDKQIELANTFADQAVIAIENVRLFDEVQARTEDLAEVAAAADRHRRRAQGDQPLDVRSADRARYAGRLGGAAVRG